MHFACDNGHFEIVKLLLEQPDIDINNKNILIQTKDAEIFNLKQTIESQTNSTEIESLNLNFSFYNYPDAFKCPAYGVDQNHICDI